MKNLATALAVPSLLATALVGCISDDTAAPTIDDGAGHEPAFAADPYSPAPAFRPGSCQEIADNVPGAADGDFTLYINDDATLRWKVYCHDMQGSPREYLSLETGDGANASMLAAASGATVATSYQRVRIHPDSFTVDIGDATFATSTGAATHDGKPVTAMPFGVAMSCGTAASMNMNLRGTAFRLELPFPFMGTSTTATTELSTDRKVLAMTVKGDCGWTAPTTFAKPVGGASQPVLRLSYFR